MVSITVHLNFDDALSFMFCPLWQVLIENGARSQSSYRGRHYMDCVIRQFSNILTVKRIPVDIK